MTLAVRRAFNQGPWRVYAISDGEAVKIGRTQGNIQRRRSDLQNGNPRELEIVGVIEDVDGIVEGQVQERLGAWHIRGEWFALTDEVRAIVEDLFEPARAASLEGDASLPTQDAVDYFGSVLLVADALKISTQAVYAWGPTVPEARAYQLQVLTDGALRAQPEKTRRRAG